MISSLGFYKQWKLEDSNGIPTIGIATAQNWPPSGPVFGVRDAVDRDLNFWRCIFCGGANHLKDEKDRPILNCPNCGTPR